MIYMILDPVQFMTEMVKANGQLAESIFKTFEDVKIVGKEIFEKYRRNDMRINFTELRKLATKGDNTEIVTKLFELEHEAIKEELMDDKHDFYTKNILNDKDFTTHKTLVAANGYDVKHLTDLVLFYGYDKVNNALLGLLDSNK